MNDFIKPTLPAAYNGPKPQGSYSTDTSPTVSIFNWKPTPIEKTVSDMALSMSEILKRKRSS